MIGTLDNDLDGEEHTLLAIGVGPDDRRTGR